MKRNISLNSAFFLLLAFSLLLPSCSEELPGNVPASGGQSLRIHVDDGGYTPASGSGEEGDAPQTRASEEEYKTVFTTDDKIGVFAVKDGKIVDEINNLRLTATASPSGSPSSLTWEQDGSGGNVELPTNATYYAYYPWQDNLTVDPTAGNAAAFFANVISAWSPADDQSDYTKYTAQDLMIADGSLSGKNLTFSMAHQMSLVVIDLPKAKYELQNVTDLQSSEAVTPVATTFGGAIPYHFTGNTYRYLVNPSKGVTLSGRYSDETPKEVAWEKDIIASSLATGQYKSFIVDGAKEVKIDFELGAGDYYMKDGSILPCNAVLDAAVASQVLGFVFWVGDPTGSDWGDPTLKKEKSDCSHGLVVSLKNVEYADAARMKWQESAESVNDWMEGENSTVKDKGYLEIATTTTSKDSKPLNQILGYNNTCVLRAYNSYCDGNGKFDNKVLPVVALDEWSVKKENRAPDTSSDWYFPSARELSTLCSGWDNENHIWNIYNISMREDVNGWVEILNDAGGSAEKLDGSWIYWSSLEYGAHFAFYVRFFNGNVNYYYKAGGEFLVRPILAF